MCFNKESSIIFFAFGMFCSFYLINRGIKGEKNKDILAGTLLFLISFMQLLEFFLWINQTCSKTNYILSLMIILLLWAQPLFTYLTGAYLSKFKIPLLHIGILLLWCILAMINIFLCSKQRQKLCSLADKDTCRLIWSPLSYLFENYNILFLLLIIGYFLVYILCPIRIPISKFFPILLFFVVAASIYYKIEKWHSIFGSIFCFFSVFYGIFVIWFG